jgi:probable F420-dependent oxidoreductase
MKIGSTVRNMGTAATKSCLLHCALQLESAGLDHVWVVDHMAIPPDDAEGSNGRWLDPLATLAFLAAATQRVDLGVCILVLPYRPALPTAKWIATIQELSGERLHLGVGAGWMQPEFDVLGVDKRQRGRITDATIDFIVRCFDAKDDVVVENGQPFLFRPSPKRPPIYVGGMSDAAMRRAVMKGDAWLPMGGLVPEKLASRVERLAAMAAEANRPCPEIVMLGGLPESQDDAVDRLGRCATLGATHYIQSSRYETEVEFDGIAERLANLKHQMGTA